MLRVVIHIPSDPVALECVLEGITALNFAMLSSSRSLGGDWPSLYDSGVRYEREPPGHERWLTIPELYDAGVGDCEDLACARAAELRLDGEPARVIVSQTPRGSYHARVLRGDGTVEDPSLLLLQREGRSGAEV